MKRSAFIPPITLNRRGRPLYRQLYDWFRAAIIEGKIRPGQRLPSTRSMAAELRISRISILNAYEQLQSEGYLKLYGGREHASLERFLNRRLLLRPGIADLPPKFYPNHDHVDGGPRSADWR